MWAVSACGVAGWRRVLWAGRLGSGPSSVPALPSALCVEGSWPLSDPVSSCVKWDECMAGGLVGSVGSGTALHVVCAGSVVYWLDELQ